MHNFGMKCGKYLFAITDIQQENFGSAKHF